MWLKIFYFIGLTNLTDEQVGSYFDYLQKARASRQRQKLQKREGRILYSPTISATTETIEQLKVYTIQAFASLAIFTLFVVTSIAADWLCGIYPQVRIMIIFKIVAWTLSALGAFCCIALVVRNTFGFIKFLFKDFQQETSGQKDAGEGRVE